MTVGVGPQIDECRAWARIAGGLGKGPNNRVLVHGQPSVEKPWISWRQNRPSAIFGDMRRHADPAVPRLDTVQRFLKDHLDLFGITDARVVGTLSTVSENPDPDGTVRLRLRQSTTVGSSPVRSEEGEMTAVFDSADELVFLSGRFLENLPVQVSAAQIPGSQARDAVIADLVAKGADSGRGVHLLDQVLFGDDPVSYELAFRVGVDPADPAVSTEAPAERDRSLETWVSARTGRVLRIRNRTQGSRNVVVTTLDLDPELIHGVDGGVSSGTEDIIERSAWIRINEPTGNIFLHDRYWLDDGEAATGVVSQTFIQDPYDSEPRWYTDDLDGVSADMGGQFATQREKRKAFTAFRGRPFDLEGADGDDYRMPGAIKEGMAHAAMHWTDPHPVTNLQGAGFSLFPCLFTSEGDLTKLRECLDIGMKIFRKAGVFPDARPRTSRGDNFNPLVLWPDCRTHGMGLDCRVVLPPDQARVDSFKLRGTENDPFSEYIFLHQVMLDTWESAASVAAASGSLSDGELFAEKFPDVALKAFLMLDDEASFIDLRNALRAASALSSSVAPHSPEIVAAIDDAFARHGIDATLESFCAENEDFCH